MDVLGGVSKYFSVVLLSPPRWLCNWWNVYYESTLQAGWNGYYISENQCNQTDTQGWELRLMPFNSMVVQLLLYDMEVWGSTISLSSMIT